MYVKLKERVCWYVLQLWRCAMTEVNALQAVKLLYLCLKIGPKPKVSSPLPHRLPFDIVATELNLLLLQSDTDGKRADGGDRVNCQSWQPMDTVAPVDCSPSWGGYLSIMDQPLNTEASAYSNLSSFCAWSNPLHYKRVYGGLFVWSVKSGPVLYFRNHDVWVILVTRDGAVQRVFPVHVDR